MDEEREINLGVRVRYYGPERAGESLKAKVTKELTLQFGGDRVTVIDLETKVEEPKVVTRPTMADKYFWPDLAEAMAFCPACEMGIDPGDATIDVAEVPQHLLCALMNGEVDA